MKVSFANLFYPLASCLFIAALLLPFVDETFQLASPSGNHEKRVLAKMPAFKTDSATFFSRAFDAFYSDHFGFRQPLINLNSKIRYSVFQSSPTPDKVGLGKNDWLYLTGRSYNITQDLTRANLYKGQELKEAVNTWETRKRELNGRHIAYYKAVWPDKNYIYPERMPFGMKLADKGGPHKCDQAMAYLKASNSPVQLIDVRAALMEAKKQQRLYFKDDSHWNNYGAFVAYTALMNTIGSDLPALKPCSASDFVIDWRTRNRKGDLCEIINMDWREEHPVFTPKRRFEMVKLPVGDYPENTRRYRNTFASTHLKALVYCDSYTEAMELFLMCHFYEVVFIWYANYSADMVERVKPDVVVECVVSRDFR